MKKSNKKYVKPSLFWYRIAQFLARVLILFTFKGKFRRNEIKHKKGAYLVLANHECALDFIYLLKATNRRATFVLSKSFRDSLPLNAPLNGMKLIAKQQFQTTFNDMAKMKAVIDTENPLFMFPAGLMPENGLSTPIPPSISII